jgi:hypothetical protein
MKRGTATINLTFEFEFARDGNDPEIYAIRSDDHLVEMGDKERKLWSALPESLREQILADAWEDAEDDGDQDAACDDERAPAAE